MLELATFFADSFGIGLQAVLCLEYIDHDFYVFKNKQGGKISVVYKRNNGGVGLIEPE